MRLNPQTYVLTTMTYQRRRLFQRTANAELLIETILRYRTADRFLLHGFVIRPDHLHVLLTPTESIEKTAQLIKGGYSFAIRTQHTGEVWQPGYFAHRITDPADYDMQLGYIASNPTRKHLLNCTYVHTTGTWPLDVPPSQSRTEN